MAARFAPVLVVCLACAAAETAQAQEPTWRLARDRVIAGEGADHALTHVVGFAVRADGAVALSDWQDRRVFLFDPHGRFVRALGRPGQGPGEFTGVPSVAFRGDSIVASDYMARRITVFAPDGRVARTVTLPERGSATMLPDGSVVIYPSTLIRGETRTPPTIVTRRRVSPTNAVAARADTVLVAAPGARILRIRIGSMGSEGLQPLDDHPLFTALPDGGHLLVDRTTDADHTLRLVRLDVRGDTVWTRALHYTPQPVPRAMVESTLARHGSGSPGASDPTVRQRYRDALWVPPHLPSATRVKADERGMIWLRREEPAPGRPQRWTVLDPRGRPAAQVEVPAALEVLTIRGGALWGVEEDADGVPSIVRHRIVRP